MYFMVSVETEWGVDSCRPWSRAGSPWTRHLRCATTGRTVVAISTQRINASRERYRNMWRMKRRASIVSLERRQPNLVRSHPPLLPVRILRMGYLLTFSDSTEIQRTRRKLLTVLSTAMLGAATVDDVSPDDLERIRSMCRVFEMGPTGTFFYSPQVTFHTSSPC
eukprot:7964173-Pyramimonas_sp.AAC.2